MGIYFTAVYGGLSARVVCGNVKQATELKNDLRARNIRCGMTSTCTIHFTRDESEIRTADLILKILSE